MKCPKCQEDVRPKPVGFTWWGGMIGAKLINHVSCPECGARFHGKTGEDNTSAIVIYMLVSGLVVGVLAFGVVFAISKSMR